MTDDNLNFDVENIEFHIITLFEKLEVIRKGKISDVLLKKIPVRTELRTLEFWKSVISECLASFIYVFLVCGANAASRMGSTSAANIFMVTAIASGFAMMFLTQFFGHVSGKELLNKITLIKSVQLFSQLVNYL